MALTDEQIAENRIQVLEDNAVRVLSELEKRIESLEAHIERIDGVFDLIIKELDGEL